MSPILKRWAPEGGYYLSQMFNFDEIVSPRRQKAQGVKLLTIKCGLGASAKLPALAFILGLGLFSKVSGYKQF